MDYVTPYVLSSLILDNSVVVRAAKGNVNLLMKCRGFSYAVLLRNRALEGARGKNPSSVSLTVIHRV